MKRVDQTKFEDEGNCFQAALASLLEMELEKVPNFVNLYSADKDWLKKCSDWLSNFGLGIMDVHLMKSEENETYFGYYIGEIKQSKNKWSHAVIMKWDKLIFDVNPENRKVKNRHRRPESGFFIILDDISKFKKYLEKKKP